MHSKYLLQTKTKKTAHQNALEREAFLALQESSTGATATQEKQRPVKARDQLGDHAAELKSYLRTNVQHAENEAAFFARTIETNAPRIERGLWERFQSWVRSTFGWLFD